MKSQAGFTFTELLTVVTVMAMLAAVAVPRYALMNSDTRGQAVRSLAANVKSSAALSNKIWKATGRPMRLMLDGRSVDMRYGYPTDTSIAEIVVMNDGFAFAEGYWKHNDSAAGQGCAVLYIPPPNPQTQATVISYTDGC
ncbi:MAG TPA: type II secretion system protein [Woeseiaceae bacterium]|nr:type II secretion system protein [Woeseiaceae bacterium]